MEYSDIVDMFESMMNPKAIQGMARYGITPAKSYGISIPDLRHIARGIGANHDLAERLWQSGSREARILASMIDDPRWVTSEQMEEWAGGFDYWEICDQVCANLFDKTSLVWQKALEWSQRDEASHKRAGFVLITRLALISNKASDDRYEPFLKVIQQQARDDRNMVKRSISWALRQIGKRNIHLNSKAIAIANDIRQMDSRAARWIANDVLRELKSQAVQKRLGA